MIIWKKQLIRPRQSRPAIFLDRDGVINEERGYIASVNDLHIYDYIKECINIFHEKGYYAIVITNQSGLARGIIQERELTVMNEMIGSHTSVDAIYCCPHYEKGNVKKYAVLCDCRKPKTGLLEQAVSDFNVNLPRSYMVGDRASDILMGKNAGIKTVLVKTGYGIENLEAPTYPDYILRDLREFAVSLDNV